MAKIIGEPNYTPPDANTPNTSERLKKINEIIKNNANNVTPEPIKAVNADTTSKPDNLKTYIEESRQQKAAEKAAKRQEEREEKKRDDAKNYQDKLGYKHTAYIQYYSDNSDSMVTLIDGSQQSTSMKRINIPLIQEVTSNRGCSIITKNTVSNMPASQYGAMSAPTATFKLYFTNLILVENGIKSEEISAKEALDLIEELFAKHTRFSLKCDNRTSSYMNNMVINSITYSTTADSRYVDVVTITCTIVNVVKLTYEQGLLYSGATNSETTDGTSSTSVNNDDEVHTKSIATFAYGEDSQQVALELAETMMQNNHKVLGDFGASYRLGTFSSLLSVWGIDPTSDKAINVAYGPTPLSFILGVDGDEYTAYIKGSQSSTANDNDGLMTNIAQAKSGQATNLETLSKIAVNTDGSKNAGKAVAEYTIVSPYTDKTTGKKYTSESKIRQTTVITQEPDIKSSAAIKYGEYSIGASTQNAHELALNLKLSYPTVFEKCSNDGEIFDRVKSIVFDESYYHEDASLSYNYKDDGKMLKFDSKGNLLYKDFTSNSSIIYEIVDDKTAIPLSKKIGECKISDQCCEFNDFTIPTYTTTGERIDVTDCSLIYTVDDKMNTIFTISGHNASAVQSYESQNAKTTEIT